MGLLSQILSSVLGSSTSTEQQHSTLSSVIDLIHNPSVGGLSGLTGLFQNAGLGHLMQGWISTGPNPPATAGQMSQVLGQQRIAELAAKLGIPPDQAAQQLSQILPQVIDHMTPNGTPPAQPSTAASVFDMIKSKLLSH